MIISVGRNISRRWSLQFSRNGNAIAFSRIYHQQGHEQQRRAYLHIDPNLIGRITHHSKIHNYRISLLHSSRTFCSSFSSSQKYGGFLKWYLGMLENHPFITKGISSSLIFAAADVTSQVFVYTNLSVHHYLCVLLILLIVF